MAHRYPNTPVTGALTQLLDQLRRSFPTTLTADTLKKLGIGPNNESYLLNVLRFIGVLDENSTKTPAASDVFSRHKDDEFEAGFGKLVRDAYDELFQLHGEGAWDLSRDELIHFFRSADDSSQIVGKRQTGTFEVLAQKAGHRANTSPAPRPAAEKKGGRVSKKVTVPTPKKDKSAGSPKAETQRKETPARDVGLTVRVEVNLPAEGDQATYDRIFKSIRQYLLNG